MSRYAITEKKEKMSKTKGEHIRALDDMRTYAQREGQLKEAADQISRKFTEPEIKVLMTMFWFSDEMKGITDRLKEIIKMDLHESQLP